jgi:hypothetical protein
MNPYFLSITLQTSDVPDTLHLLLVLLLQLFLLLLFPLLLELLHASRQAGNGTSRVAAAAAAKGEGCVQHWQAASDAEDAKIGCNE